MNKTVFAAVALALGACAADSVDQISARPPAIVKSTPQSVDAVSGCLQRRFLSFGSDMRIVRDDHQVDLLIGSYQMGSFRYAWKLSIDGTTNGSRVLARKADAPFVRLPESDMREAITACAA